MDTPTVKDYIDAKDEAILATSREFYAMVESRLAQMETRMTNKLMDGLKWSIGAMIAGMTLTISVTTYMQVLTLNRVEVLSQEVRTLQTNVNSLQTNVNSLQTNVNAMQTNVNAMQTTVSAIKSNNR